MKAIKWTFLGAALTCGAAMAQMADGTVTQAQVEAEQQQTKHSGQLFAQGDHDYPHQYVDVNGPSKTRAEVLAEFENAKRDGDVMSQGDRGWTDRELYAHRFAKPSEKPLDRASVRADLERARSDRSFALDIYSRS